jgi:hypothetical protein
MTNIENILQQQEEKRQRKAAKAARRKLDKSMKVLTIKAYKRAVREKKYTQQRDTLIDFIVNYPLQYLRMNVVFKPLKEHKHLSYAV